MAFFLNSRSNSSQSLEVWFLALWKFALVDRWGLILEVDSWGWFLRSILDPWTWSKLIEYLEKFCHEKLGFENEQNWLHSNRLDFFLMIMRGYFSFHPIIGSRLFQKMKFYFTPNQLFIFFDPRSAVCRIFRMFRIFLILRLFRLIREYLAGWDKKKKNFEFQNECKKLFKMN